MPYRLGQNPTQAMRRAFHDPHFGDLSDQVLGRVDIDRVQVVGFADELAGEFALFLEQDADLAAHHRPADHEAELNEDPPATGWDAFDRGRGLLR